MEARFIWPGVLLGARACGQGRVQGRLRVGVPAPVGLRPKVGDDALGLKAKRAAEREGAMATGRRS
jgi:hypothetical protein